MIRFAGVDLLLPDEIGQLGEWLKNYQPLSDTTIAAEVLGRASDNWRGRYSEHTATPGIPKFNWPAVPSLELNQLYWPTGAGRWSIFLGLVDTDRKDDILDVLGPQVTGTLVLGDSRIAPTAIESQPTGMFIRQKIEDEWLFAMGTEMYLLPPRPVSAKDDVDGTPGLWLIPLVDVRYHWQLRHTGDLSDLDTWDDYYSTLATQLGITSAFSHDTVDADYFTPSDELERSYCSAAELLDVVAANCGHRIVRDVAGNVSAQSAATAETKLDENLNGDEPYDIWNQIAGGDFSETADGSIRPENVVVTFPVMTAAGNNRSVSVESNTATDTDNATGLTKVFRDTAHFSAESSDEMGLLADQITEDYYAWLTKRFDYTFTAVKPWQPTGFDDAILWSFGAQREDKTYKADSRVCSLPYNFGIEELHHKIGTDQTETCGYEAHARCNGNQIENCTYYVCRNKTSHELVTRTLVDCDTDSSSSDTTTGGNGIESELCEYGVPSSLIYDAYNVVDDGNVDDDHCFHEISALWIQHDGETTWTGSGTVCGLTLTVTFLDNEDGTGTLTLAWSGGCEQSIVTDSASPGTCSDSTDPGTKVFDWQVTVDPVDQDFADCFDSGVSSFRVRLRAWA